MRRTCALFAFALAITLPGNAAQQVTVEQLEHILTDARSTPDNDLAAKLADLRLTERLTSSRLARWGAQMPGARSERALLGLADRSAFLELPAAEIPTTPAPTLAEQRRIMGLTATYVAKAIPQLPRFYATRSITHFEDAPGSGDGNSADGGGSLRAVRISRATVTYREGEEITEPGPVKVEKPTTPDRGLRTWGAFGPILGLVLLDAAQNKLQWSRWEQASGGPIAVFRYAVPKEKSHYEVRYCCVAASYGLESNDFHEMSAYHGQITVDPASGTILRLTLEADLGANEAISRAAIAVEYGPQELGGVTYICPLNSVSISMARTVRNVRDAEGRDWPTMGPVQMLLNHTVFDQYHLFRSETRVLSAGEERAAGVAPDATLSSVQPAPVGPTEEVLSDAPAAKVADMAGSRPVIDAAAAADENAEISTKAATGLPEVAPGQAVQTTDRASQPAVAQSREYTLRVSSRLVDVNVVALDKKGQPITNLKAGDFEVYDDGVKQDLRSFSQTDVNAAGQFPAQTAEITAPTVVEFSNHAKAKDTKAGANQGNAFVMLIDASNLSYPDLAGAREQMIHFLQTLPPNERVALYVSRYHRFQVLEEPTTDHALLMARLKQWKPNPQDMANANDEEERNRQTFEYVHSPEDMLSVNGNFTMDTFTQSEPLDPRMREMGSNPGPNALSILVDVARHLAVIPGHKSLVWVTSDNALADWNKLSITIEKGSKYIEPAALRTQEAMNNAHVSIYPLDASRLEAAVVTPEIGGRNVELTPTFERPLGLETQIEGPEAASGPDMNPYIQNRNLATAGRLSAQMQQDIHPIQGVFREVAEATGGRALRRSNNMVGQLNGVIADGHATYLLGFSPSQPADGQYHLLTVKLVSRRDVTLRYRTGYQYDKEPATLKDRFKQAVWEPGDASEIALKARPVTDAAGNALRVTVAGTDLDLAQQNALWTGKLDIFMVRRDEESLRAAVSGKTVGLRLKQTTYQKAIDDGLTFDERLEGKLERGSLRVIVVDGNSGRIGSVTVPTTALGSKP
jgi:VWFA-related protein